MGVVIIIIVGLIFILVLNAKSKIEKQEEANSKNTNIAYDIRRHYKDLIKIVISTYNLKTCPRCFENQMELLSISPTGQSVEYECSNCSKKITSRIIIGKDGSEAVHLMSEIKQLMGSFVAPLDPEILKMDAENTIIVNTNSYEQKDGRKRIPIPEDVRNAVWRRDGGKCVICGSSEKLEFDHLIPFSKGGSNTTRNIQLLCEKCNRSKKDKIG